MQHTRFSTYALSLLLCASTLLVVSSTAQRRHEGAATPTPTPVPTLKFNPGCTLPFDSIKGQGLAIDQRCGVDGTARSTSANGKQNEVKNNFCATGTPVTLTFADIDRLQQAAAGKGVTFGGESSLPTNRSVLGKLITVSGQQVGEGSVATLEGVVFDARHSNTTVLQESGESVNCKSGDLDMNDIHIELAESSGFLNPSDECKTVTAEISPHFRPASWNRFDVNKKEAPLVNGLPLKGVRVRITGQLFFDASHKPCVNGQGSAPKRRSIWEVHPVYAIEVFDTTTNKFVALDKWAQGK